VKQAKRRYGAGGLYKPSGCVNYTMYYSRNGKRYREATGTANYADAMHQLKLKCGDIARGDAIDPRVQKLRLTDLWEAFLQSRQIKGCGLEHLTRRWTKHLEPFLGQVRISQLGDDALMQYIAHRQQEGAENATINREIAIVRGMLRMGFYAKPQKVKSLPKFPQLDESQNVRKGFLDPQKYQTLADNASKIGIWMRALFEIAYTWGWRKSELRLRVEQVDFNANVVRLDTSKNGKGREVTMTPTIHTLLSECARGKKPSDLLFSRDNGTVVKSFRAAWKRICVASGVAGLTVHDLRRTAVRNMVRAGVPEHTAMAISGHKTRSVFDRYDIVDQRDIANAMLKLEQSRAENVTKCHKNEPARVSQAAPSVN
jgi:integrase